MNCHGYSNRVTDHDFSPVADLIPRWYKCCNWQFGYIQYCSKLRCPVCLISQRHDGKNCQRNLSCFMGLLQICDILGSHGGDTYGGEDRRIEGFGGRT